MSASLVIAALDSLAAAIGQIGGGDGNVQMLPLVAPRPTAKFRNTRAVNRMGTASSISLGTSTPGMGGTVMLKFTFADLMNLRDMVAIAGTVTLRFSVGGYTKDAVYMFSESAPVGIDGLSANLALNTVDIFNSVNTVDGSLGGAISVSVVAWEPTSCVRYVGV